MKLEITKAMKDLKGYLYGLSDLIEIEKILFQVFDDGRSYGVMVLYFKGNRSAQFRIKSVDSGFYIHFSKISNLAGEFNVYELHSFTNKLSEYNPIKINKKQYGVFTNIYPRFLKFKIQVRIEI